MKCPEAYILNSFLIYGYSKPSLLINEFKTLLCFTFHLINDSDEEQVVFPGTSVNKSFSIIQ